MTLIVAALASTMCLLLASMSVQLGKVASTRARAQTAADAAALAAVAESAPAGGGDPAGAAARLAAANDAEVLACSCLPGATSVQVTVSVEDVEASARAVLDPTLLEPFTRTASTAPRKLR